MAYERNELTVRIADVLVNIRRASSQPVPHELTVVIPHAEIRRRFYRDGQVAEEEVILNTITVIDSPRHQPSGHLLQLPPPPRTTWRFTPEKI